MSLIINHNLMAMNAARNLGQIYNRLAKSTERLSSGLRINSAGDDAAGLAIRELMRADIAVMNQGIRNASDGISMIQTAEGAMAVMDEKLTRMKELAEQAATGTYTTVQREIMNSEYIAMADEVDRIARATEFNGTKLLDGSLSDIHGGSGMKVHFGTGNSSLEDYYFIKIGDVRAQSSTGLRIGGDAANDIWGNTGGGPTGVGGPCCGGNGPETLDEAFFTNATSGAFVYGYDYLGGDYTTANNTLTASGLATPSYIAGAYEVSSGSSLRDLINAVNAGTQSRIRVDFNVDAGTSMGLQSSGYLDVCLGENEVYQFQYISGTGAFAGSTEGLDVAHVISANATLARSALAVAINGSSMNYWAMVSAGANAVFIFRKDGGDFNSQIGCDRGNGTTNALSAENAVTWRNMETGEINSAGTTFALGGEDWGTLQGVKVGEHWGVTLNGRDVGNGFDLRILDAGLGGLNLSGMSTLSGFDSRSFTEYQDAADGAWVGAHIRTQSHAQEALDAIQDAIERKDIVRANLGAYQNRLENTITNLTIMAENLQASESRISDVDVATEMTVFTRNNILAQAATSMLAQANSLPQLALTLLG